MKKVIALAALLSAPLLAATPPAPYGPVPTPRQLAWHELELYGFCHFTVNTFTDKEWGYGDEPESVFNPTDFDADALIGICKDAGLRGMILTCKHHDGFCLWPSPLTKHSVKNSPWQGGTGDVVRAFSAACRAHGLKFGTYLSPWDRNHAEYSRPAYLEYFRAQLRDLMTNYGDIFEVWFDGANGGDGFYGGARERRSINNLVYYDWSNTWQIVRDLQTNAVMFSDAGPDVRWVGNESGFAGDPCWATQNRDDFAPGHADGGRLNRGDRPGTHWVPAEVDVSIRPGWFYHASQDGQVKSPQRLMQIYFESVGRGASFLLNIPPDRRGRIHENDAASLHEFGRLLRALYATNLADGAKATAANYRGGAPAFGPARVLDGKTDTYWTTDDAVTNAAIELWLKQPSTFNVVSLREHLPLGQRVETWAIDIQENGAWREVAAGKAIGSRRLWRGPDLTTDRVRIRVAGPVCPALSEIALYREPAESRAGRTFDTAAWRRLNRTGWKIASASYATPDSGAAERAIDGNPATLWHTHGPDGEKAPPQELVLDLGAEKTVTGFVYLPRADGTTRGIVDRYEVYVGGDGKTWAAPAAAGEFGNMKANPIEQQVKFAQPARGRYVRFVALHSADGNHVTCAEFGVQAE